MITGRGGSAAYFTLSESLSTSPLLYLTGFALPYIRHTMIVTPITKLLRIRVYVCHHPSLPHSDSELLTHKR
jgi:hypothetical protein